MNNEKLTEALREANDLLCDFQSHFGVLPPDDEDDRVAWERIEKCRKTLAAHAADAARAVTNDKLVEALRDLENRIIQRLAWLREGSLIDIQAFTADIEAMLLHLHAAEAAQTMTPSELADRIARGEKWKLAESLRDSFEKWFATQETYMANRLTRLPNGDYQWTETQFAWLAWQAHAADEAVQRPSAEWFDQRLHENLLPRKTDTAQAQAQNGEWVMVPRKLTRVMAEVACEIGVTTEDWYEMLAAAPQPQAAEPFCWWRQVQDYTDEYVTEYSQDSERPKGAGWEPLYTNPQPAQDALEAVLEVALSIMDANDPLNAARLRKMRDAAMAKESGR